MPSTYIKKHYRRQVAIMKDFEFSCPNCDEPFVLLLPEQTTLASFIECDDEDTRRHNLPHVSQCQNCEQRNTIYYCISGHPLIATGD